MDTSYQVAGMTCDHCVRSVTAELIRLPGVRAVTVDLAAGRVDVDSEHRLDPTAVESAIVAAGYRLA